MEKNLTGLKERLTAIGDFANESVKLIDELLAKDVPAAKEVKSAPTAKPTKPVKGKEAEKAVSKPAKKAVAPPVAEEEEDEENPLAEIIADYELADKSIPELKELLNDAEIVYNKKAKNIDYFIDTVAQAIADGKIGEDDDEDDSVDGEDDGEEADDVSDDDAEEATQEEIDEAIEEYGLKDLDLSELKSYCDDYKLAYLPKPKKSALVQIVGKAIAEGVIPLGDDEDESEDEDSSAPETDEDDVSEEEEVSEEVLEAESKVRANVAKQIKTKKLTVKKIKEFLKQYYEGDADCKDCKGCSDEEVIECYADIQAALVDDDAEVMEMGSSYTRKGTDYCCGKELKELENGNLYCEICAEEWDTSEE